MAAVRAVVNGKEILADAGQTILEACTNNDIHIPTLCSNNHLKPFDSCWISAVDVQGYGLVAACTNDITDGLTIQTDNAKVASARKQCLESLLSEHYGDCIAPCQLACPAGIDIPGYIALIERGAYREAVELIKEALPLPAIIGRICPHPCEQACRRNLVEQPIAICSLKRFVADCDLFSEKRFTPAVKSDSGYKVAIVGSGPAGLSAAYYLAQEGHKVIIFEALPDPGGMLRYGIPAYRLPKDLLDQEIATITELGVNIVTKQALGKDFTIDSLRQDGFHAIMLAIGAHQSQKMNVENEDSDGVLPGTNFLRAISLGEHIDLGDKVAVIGGGNTAIDAARTALRLGAKDVTIIYRRSRAEMPASEWEIEEAEEEGVNLHFMAAPTKIMRLNGRVNSIECIKMALGEPDASGRPRPEPLAGSEFALEVDTVIAAIGQRPDLSPLTRETDIKTERGNIVVASDTLATDMKDVFASGDCITGAATAVEAIASGKKAATAINHYLKGEKTIIARVPFNVSKGQLNELTKEEFLHFEHQPRQKMPKLSVKESRSNFRQIELGYTEEMAKLEAQRCLECACKAAPDCSLRQLATEYDVSPPAVKRDRIHYPVDNVHPFIERDPNKCISCERCIQICHDINSFEAISIGDRVGAFKGYGSLLPGTTCVSCGQCVSACPVGALVPKNSIQPAREIKTICSYCGVGCGIYLGIRGNIIVNARGDTDNLVNKGRLCVKGRFGYDYVNHPNRLTSPLIKRDGVFVNATWEEALDLVASKLSHYKGDQFAFIASAKCTNEENYLAQKFARMVMQTNNIDHCARLCHAPTVAGLAQAFGSGAMTNSINEIGEANCIFVIGSNTTSGHPIIALEIKKAVRNGTKLIVANPREIELCRYAHVWLRHHPGTDVALLMGMMRIIMDEHLADSAFIEEHCENFGAFKESLKDFDSDLVEKITGVPKDDIVEAARVYAEHKHSSIIYAMGITQHSHGTDNVLATANLAMLTGNIGKPSTGVNPLRGQNNVQGACDMGALPNVYTAYQRVDNPDIQEKFERAWECRLDNNPGLPLTEMIDAAYDKQIKAMYLMGENPVISDPNAKHVEQALSKLEFLVVQDIFLTETAELADVVLPAASFAEKNGTFTNTERRVQRVRKALEPIGNSKPDWWIICQVAKKLGAKDFYFEHPSQIMDELASLTPSYGGITYERLESGGLQWPCPIEDHPGTPTLHIGRFARGKGKFSPLTYKPPAELPDKEYPLILTTGRSLYHFHTGTMTRKVDGLNAIKPEGVVEINPVNAHSLNIADGSRVKVASRRGKVIVKARVTDESPPGVVYMDFHFAESAANILTNPALDPISKIPEFKVCAAKIEGV